MDIWYKWESNLSWKHIRLILSDCIYIEKGRLPFCCVREWLSFSSFGWFTSSSCCSPSSTEFCILFAYHVVRLFNQRVGSMNIGTAKSNHPSGWEGPIRGPVLHIFWHRKNLFHWSAFRADSRPCNSTIAAGVKKVHLLSVQKAHCPTREIQKAINAAPE